MGEICIPNVESYHEVEIKNALEAISKCTKAQITVETVTMLRINWPVDHPELGGVIRAIVGIAPEKPHIRSLIKQRGRPPKLDPMGS
jgi:hypothetical protein